jgi:hypothetical protein
MNVIQHRLWCAAETVRQFRSDISGRKLLVDGIPYMTCCCVELVHQPVCSIEDDNFPIDDSSQEICSAFVFQRGTLPAIISALHFVLNATTSANAVPTLQSRSGMIHPARELTRPEHQQFCRQESASGVAPR